MKRPFPPRDPRGALPLVSWALYDFANTIFSILVVTRYLPPLVRELTGRTTPMGAAAALSMITAGFLVPVLGAVSDRTGRARAYLLFSTLVCLCATALLSLPRSPLLLLLLFVTANVAYQVSLVFYNSLLPTVSRPEHFGAVSGLGVGLGYAGSFFALISANLCVGLFGIRSVFLLASCLFLLFSLPLFLWVRGAPVASSVPLNRHLIYGRILEVTRTVRRLPQEPEILFFLLGNFLCLDAVHTTILFFSEYMQRARGLSGGEIDLCLIAIQLSALCSSFLIGRLTDRLGPRIVMTSVAGVWIAVVVAVLAARSFGVILAASAAGGLGLAGIWVTGRAWILALSPPDQAGKYLGLYGLTGKFSAAGALIFGLLTDLLSYDTALAFQLLLLAAGAALFARTGRSGH